MGHKHHRTVEVEISGLGPATIRVLSRGRAKRLVALARSSDPGPFAAKVVRRGLVSPELTSELAARLGADDDTLAALCEQILEHSDYGDEYRRGRERAQREDS